MGAVSASSSRPLVVATYAICLAIALVPVLALRHPPLVDYPNHLARLWILTHPDDPDLAANYRIDWSLLPNLGFDLIGYALASVMPVEMAGRVFLGLSLAVLLAAPVALHHALYNRFSPLPLVAGALLFSRVVQMGFLGYLLGAGIAIWGFVAWYHCRRAGWATRFAVLQAATLLLFICHLYALAVLAVLVGMSAASEGWRAAPASFMPRVSAAVRAALIQAPAFILPALLLVLASKTASAGSGIEYEALWLKFFMLPLSMMVDNSALGLVLAEVALLPAIMARLGGGRMVHPAVIWPAAALLILYFPMPDTVLSSQNADWRILIPLVFVLIGSAEDPFRGPRARGAIAVLAVSLTLGGTWNAWTFWRDGDRIAGQLSVALTELPRGALLIPYIPGEEEFRNAYRPPAVLHIAARAVIERAALVPTVFTIAGQQPIELRPAADEAVAWHDWLHVGGPPPPGLARLTDPANYVLEVRTAYPARDPVPPMPLPADVVAQSGQFTLYRLLAGPE